MGQAVVDDAIEDDPDDPDDEDDSEVPFDDEDVDEALDDDDESPAEELDDEPSDEAVVAPTDSFFSADPFGPAPDPAPARESVL
ncbi:hypothetical protein GCM10027053_35860 [Intrasporangium mesophilum]